MYRPTRTNENTIYHVNTTQNKMCLLRTLRRSKLSIRCRQRQPYRTKCTLQTKASNLHHPRRSNNGRSNLSRNATTTFTTNTIPYPRPSAPKESHIPTTNGF